LLARGSAFCVRGPETGVVVALASAHVSAPHLYRRYFPADWLSFVKDEHVRCAVGGAKVPLTKAFRHTSLDVAAVVLAGVDETRIPVLELARDEAGAVGAEVWVDGCVASGNRECEDTAGGGVTVRLDGKVMLVDGVSRAFVDTGDKESAMGMCGGPVVRREDGVVVGLLEGLVPKLEPGEEALSTQHGTVAGMSAIVTAVSLRLFLADVEQEWAAADGK
jgi:hypothetical protein